MADLTADDVTVTIGQGCIDMLHFNKMVFPTLAFGDAAKTYPAGGIPLPALGYFDLYQQINFAPLVQSGSYFYVVDITNHKLKILDEGLSEFAGAPAATEVKLQLIGQ